MTKPRKKNNAQWCVTAINRLTGQRETVTPPCSNEKAEAIKQAMITGPSVKRAYIYPIVKVYQTSFI